MDPRNLTELVGASYFISFSSVGKVKKLLLLGEMHILSDVSKCSKNGYKLIDWILDLSKETHKVIDLYVESFFLVEDSVNELIKLNKKSYMTELIDHFQQQYVLQKSERNFQGLRYHYSDIRTLKIKSEKSITLHSMLTEVDVLLLKMYNIKSTILIDIKYLIDNVENIIKCLMGSGQLRSKPYNNTYYKIFMLKTMSYLSMSRDSIEYWENNYNKYMKIYLEIITKRRNKTYLNIEMFDNVFAGVLIKLLNTILENALINKTQNIRPIRLRAAIQLIGNIPIHYYTLLRMFTEFTTGDSPEYVISVSGCNHTNFYADVISQFFYIQPDISITNKQSVLNEYSDQCILLDKPYDILSL